MLRQSSIAALMAALIAAPIASAAHAGDVAVVEARALRVSDGWRFDVTLRHGDTGWEHYADAWEVRGPDGAVYGRRTLLHPHETEQPFTRALSGVAIPADVAEVTIHARDNVHGWSPDVLTLRLPE